MRPRRSAYSISALRADPTYKNSLILLVIAAVFLGGGHIFAPVRNGLIEILALLLLLRLCWRSQRAAPLPIEARAPLFFFLAVLVLLLIQMLPFVPAGLPGHEAVDATMALTAPGAGWHSLSLYPAATARFAMSLIVPLVACLLTIRATSAVRLVGIKAIALLAAGSAVLGMVQLALGSPGWMSPFGLSDPNVADGLFVNRNHQAMFLLCGLIATATWIALEQSGSGAPLRLRVNRFSLHLAWLLIPLLALMVVAAGSKAGIGLLVIVLPCVVLVALPKGKQRVTGFGRWLAPLATIAVLASVILLVTPADVTDRLRSQLIFHGDARLEFMPDLLLLLGQFWPLGSGAGTFVPAYKLIEDLDKLTTAYLNHAHNDYIEWVTETGAAGLILLVGGVAAIVIQLSRVFRSNRSSNRKLGTLTGLGMVLILALHSAVDYPLRTDALATIFGVALGLIFAPALDMEPQSASSDGVRSTGRNLLFAVFALVGLVSAIQMMRLRLSEVAADNANPGLAEVIGTNDGFARAYVAEALLADGQNALAREEAIRAIRTAPLAVVAVRTLAFADSALHRDKQARADWRAATLLGWRDVPTQYWALKQALQDGELATAGMRTDAIMRMIDGHGAIADALRLRLADPKFRAALIPRMLLRPDWRLHFMHWQGKWTVPELAGMLPLTLELQQTSAPPLRIETRDLLYTLIELQRWSDAVAVDAPFAAQRGHDPGSLIDDGGFNKPDSAYFENASPFEWNRATGTLDQSPPTTMVVSSDGKSDQLGVSRYVALSPGRYAISFETRGPKESPQSLEVRATCPGGILVGVSPKDDLASESAFVVRQFAFDVTSACPVALIGINSRANGETVEAEFDNIRLWRISPAAATTR